MSVRCRSRVETFAIVCRDAIGRAAAARLVTAIVVVLVALPGTASAQRERFFEVLLPFYQSLAGVYGDEGAQLLSRLDALSMALTEWDRELAAAEMELRGRLQGGSPSMALEVHTVLASLYAERGRFDEALREIEDVLRIDSSRPVFHRFRALLYRAAGRPADAADAFRAAWTIDPKDPQNAYHLIVSRSAVTPDLDVQQALTTLAELERDLIARRRSGAESPFLSLTSVNDDFGGGLAFAPAAYARAFSLLLGGEFAQGLAAVRAAVAADPLVADPAAGSEPMARGSAELREGRVDAAIEHLASAAARASSSSEAHRMLGTAHGINGDLPSAVRHLRDAVRLQASNERAWVTLARTLDTAGELTQAIEVLREAVAELPESGALRWLLATASGPRQRTDDSHLELIAVADRLVMLAGRSDLYRRVARLAEGHLEYARAADLLEQAVALTPNSATAHLALGRAYGEYGREDAGYAELAIALLLDTDDGDTHAALGRLHLSAGRYADAVAALERAVALQSGDGGVLQALGDALVRAGRVAEGQSRIEEAEQRRAADVEEHRKRRRTAMLTIQADHSTVEGQVDRAIELWEQVIDLEGPTVANHLRLADALERGGQLSRAATLIDTSIALGAAPDAHRRLAEVYEALGRTADAARERRRYVEKRLEQLRDPSGDAEVIQ